MGNEMNTWIVIALAALGVGAAIAGFLRTPREQRYRGVQQTTLEEQLKNYPESTQAVIIRANKRRALVKLIPLILIGVVLGGFTLWSRSTSHPECVRLLGFNAAYILLLLVCYGLPISVFVGSLLFFGTGIKTLKTGYFPPLDSVVFGDTIAKKGVISTLRGIGIIALPFLTFYILYLGNSAYATATNGKNMHEIIVKLEAKCR